MDYTWDYRKYLLRDEAREIRTQFRARVDSYDRLMFWNGLRRDRSQCWARDHGLMTLSDMMGPLMDPKSPRYKKLGKTKTAWKRYMKGASGLFAEYACQEGVVTVITQHPGSDYIPRSDSSFYNIEKPILEGLSCRMSACRIDFVHPAVIGAEDFRYQVWPHDETELFVRSYGSQLSVQEGWAHELGIESHV